MKIAQRITGEETCCIYCEKCGRKMVNVNEGREALHWGQAWYECTNIDCPLCPEAESILSDLQAKIKTE